MEGSSFRKREDFLFILFSCWRLRLFISRVCCRIIFNCTWLSIFIINIIFSFFYFRFVRDSVSVSVRVVVIIIVSISIIVGVGVGVQVCVSINIRINNRIICIRIFIILIFIIKTIFIWILIDLQLIIYCTFFRILLSCITPNLQRIFIFNTTIS